MLRSPCSIMLSFSLVAVLLHSFSGITKAEEANGALLHIALRSDFRNLQHRLQQSETPVHVAFLGGSITENAGGHSRRVPEWLKAQFPAAEFRVTQAGLSSTCSTSGAFRLADHVLAHGPLDLLVVEFAVNDDQDAGHAARECVRGMEGIVRQVRRTNPQCEIIMVHFVNPPILEQLQAGQQPVSIAAHHKVAEHYGVTELNVAAAVAEGIAQGEYSWQDYGGTHPKPFGYKLATDMITTAIAEGMQRANDDAPPVDYPLPSPLDAQSYDRGHFISPAAAHYGAPWRLARVSRESLPLGGIRKFYTQYEALRSDEPGATLTLKFTGRAVGAFILAGPDAGRVTTTIDDGSPTQHDLYHHFSSGLNYPRSVIFASELAPGEHVLKLTISAEKNTASCGHAATILFFEVNR